MVLWVDRLLLAMCYLKELELPQEQRLEQLLQERLQVLG